MYKSQFTPLLFRNYRLLSKAQKPLRSLPTTSITSKATYSTVSNIKPSKSSSSKYSTLFKFGIVIGLASTLLYYTNDSFKHTILTVERVKVVTVAMIRCFALYKETLGRTYETDHERHQALAKTHKQAAEITLKALEKNGGIYIKLGQHITALTYLLPPEWTDTMIPLQDKCPQSSMAEIEKLFENDLGKKLSDLFIEFDPNPVGVASLAQVHIAKLKTGEKVAVKIQHPSLKEFVPLDVALTKMVFDLMYKAFPEYPLTWLGEEMQNSIFVELDFTEEAKNSIQTAEYFKNLQRETALRIPKIVEAQSRILIMEYAQGERLDNLKYMKDNNIDPSDVSSCLSHIFNSMIFTPGVSLHCDPHGGNLAIRKLETPKNGHNFEIILYDHGLYRQIPLEMKRDYSHFWLAVLDNDIPNMKKYSQKIANLPDDDQKFRIFMSAITGRAPDMALNYDISTRRSNAEIQQIQSQINSEGSVIEDLMDILSNMPRMVLLILKTNDLTRNLDENLSSSLGPERTFLIMANYCAKCVYEEQKENINATFRGWSWITHSVSNWWSYQKRLSSLFVYDILLMVKRLTH
ncbi:ABC1 family protein [Candida maltosa Xu316]|uniref:ABC1 family protein n=1 Tax=Candida maltosa (strain Xu316) TaxID=1245528 RepID=M3INJ4_CANMX|nr:ABC1 family protein [Candida maltosa Xu316]